MILRANSGDGAVLQPACKARERREQAMKWNWATDCSSAGHSCRLRSIRKCALPRAIPPTFLSEIRQKFSRNFLNEISPDFHRRWNRGCGRPNEVLRPRRARFPRSNGNPWLMLKPTRGVRKMAPHQAACQIFGLAMAQQRNHIAAHESRQILNHRCGVEQRQLRCVDILVGVLRDPAVGPARHERPVLRPAPPGRREI